MLIINTAKAGDTVSFRLITGENVVARLVENKPDSPNIIVNKPIVANPVNSEGGYGLAFSPFAPTIDEDMQYVIPKTNFLFMPLIPRDEIIKSYVRMTSNLAMPG